MGTLLAENSECGFALGLSLILYSPLVLPSLWNNLGNCFAMGLSTLCTAFTWVRMLRATIAGSPNRLFLRLWIMYTGWVVFRFL